MIPIKITNINNPKEFFETVAQCEGRVELVTSEGDRLNLKSKLCQYITLTQVFRDPEIKDIEVICSEPKDIPILLNFLVG